MSDQWSPPKKSQNHPKGKASEKVLSWRLAFFGVGASETGRPLCSVNPDENPIAALITWTATGLKGSI